MAYWRSRGYVEDSEDDGQSKDDDEEKSEQEEVHDGGKVKDCPPPIQAQNSPCPETDERTDQGFSLIDDFPDRQEEDAAQGSGCTEIQPRETNRNAGRVAVVIQTANGVPCGTQSRSEESVRPLSQRAGSPPDFSVIEGGRNADILRPCRVEKPAIENPIQHDSFRNTPELTSSATTDYVSVLSPTRHASSTPITSPFRDNSPSRHDTHHRVISPPSERDAQLVTDRQGFNPGTDNAHVTQDGLISGTRSLRKRNPIQLHPYRLEGERYRQILKARGVKPLRITGDSEPIPHETQPSAVRDGEFQPDDDTQAVWPIEESQSSVMQNGQDQSGNESQDAAPTQPVQVTSSSPSSRSACDPDDFPDVDLLLRRDLPGTLSQGFKRRKVAHADTEKLRRQSLSGPLPDQAELFKQFKFPEGLPELTSKSPSDYDLQLSPTPPLTTRPPNQIPRPIFADSELAATSTASEKDILEVEEDNQIDEMLPSRPRSSLPKAHYGSRKRRKRLTELSDPLKRRRTGPSDTELEHMSRSRNDNRFSAPGKGHPVGKRKPATRLSVVDATKTYDVARLSAPTFIRIAHRRVRKRKDKGRHSPTRKVFRLPTRQDTAEVQKILHDWFEGAISPVEDYPEQTGDGHRPRLPLSQVSGNEQASIGPTRGPWSFAQTGSRPITSGKPQLTPKTGHGEKEQSKLCGFTHAAAPKASKLLHPLRKPPLPMKTSPFILPWQNAKASPRPAQLESTTTRYRDRLRRPDFEARLAIFEREYQKQLLEDPAKAKVQLGRYLSDNNPLPEPAVRAQGTVMSPPNLAEHQSGTKPVSRLRVHARKRAPRRIDAQAPEFRQPADADIQILDDYLTTAPAARQDQFTLQGLGPYGTKYTVSFNIIPLEIGTFFHESTFIGSGEFAKALQKDSFASCELGRGHISVRFRSETFRWAAWNETVSSDLRRIFSWTCERLKSYLHCEGDVSDATQYQELSTVLRGVVRYLYGGLAFYDPIDRAAFVRTFSSSLRDLLDTLSSIRTTGPENGFANELTERTMVHVSTIMLVLAYQTYQIAVQGRSEPGLDAEAGAILKSTAYQLICSLKPADLRHLQSFYEGNQRHLKREAGIREEDYKVEGFVGAYHVLARSEMASLTFWDMVHAVLIDQDIAVSSQVAVFERIWNSLFTLLPLQELDEFGVLRTGRRFQSTAEGWCLPRALSSRLFSIYSSNPTGQSPKFSAYCRSIFARCHYLITSWGWRKFQDIVGTLFDFFAAHNLTHLHNEESRGSLRLLEVLDGDPNLDVQPHDPCFHILLKIIGTGLKLLCRDYPEKKIRNIVFRLIPNHGRQYPREEAVQQKDLDSLRNHHDLLCTLYWAAPPSARPSVSIIRDLVDAETSHPEACRISLRAWVNLIRFQLSADEPTTTLDSFALWHTMLIMKLLKQQDQIKSEVEAKHGSMHSIRDSMLSSSLLTSAINQSLQPVDAVLIVALTSIRDAIAFSRCVEAAIVLMSKASTADIFGLFEVRRGDVHLVIVQSLTVVKEFIRKSTELSSTYQNELGSDESQDYGDWTALVDAVGTPPLKLAAEHLRNVVHYALGRLVSNAFGADKTPDDSLLLQLVDVWVSTARMLVNQSLMEWNDYVGPYSHYSWLNLRNTEQVQKYKAYFMSKIIDADAEAYKSNRYLFLSSWMVSLVERDSRLKFQHNLTTAILNADKANPLLKNLPFWFRARDGMYSITLNEFSERRLSLISSLLMNMREVIEELFILSTNEASNRRREYAQLLKDLMGAMKSNYQELQQGTVVAGAYVDFVQAVVEFLQQYTIDICPVDKFFTDSTTFPLPAKDPTYVVGRLKHYGLKLPGVSVHKQLASFVQSVSERAAMDNQQLYLSMQLGDAMACIFEDGNPDRPTLRSFLMRAVFPAYIEYAFNSSTGWILATPILQASTRTFSELLQDVDTTNDSCVVSVIDIIDTFHDTCRRTVELLINHSGLLEQPSILNALTLMISAITASLPLLDYMQRISEEEDIYSTECLPFFSSFTKLVQQVFLTGHGAIESPYADTPELPPPLSTPYPEVRHFCAQELRDSLSKNWVRHGEQYYVLRGNVRKQVVIRLGSFEEERAGVLNAIRQFEDVLGRMTGLVDESDGNRRARIWRSRPTEDMISFVC